jgi:thiosulfate dehydrogenase (quinone) large subunit
MFTFHSVTDASGDVWYQDPPVTRWLFRHASVGRVWLLARLFVGFEFLEAAFHKFIDPTWMDGSGEAIRGFWLQAVAIPEPPARPPITFDWYRGFLQLLIDTNSAPWFSQLIVYSELAVGVALLLGAFVGLAAAAALVMNIAFMLSGVNATNPVLIMLDVLLILAWRNAGYIGLDRYLLRVLGTPWKQVAAEATPTS